MKLGSKLKMVAGAALMMVGVAGAALPAQAALKCKGSECAAEGLKDISDGNETPLMDTVTNIINLIIFVVGIVAVVMLVIGGVQYTMSQGDATQVKKAKDTILYGIVGLVVAILAWAIVNFVLDGLF